MSNLKQIRWPRLIFLLASFASCTVLFQNCSPMTATNGNTSTLGSSSPNPSPTPSPSPSPTSGNFPGQTGNPVGYSAYGQLGTTTWPGGTFVSGTASQPTIYRGYVFSGPVMVSGQYIQFVSCDFDSGTGGVNITGSNISFIGSRFQSNDVENYNVQTTGTNITFSYDSFTPLASFYTTPPGSAWPSAGTGQNTTTQTTDLNAINGNDGYEYGIAIDAGGPVTIDHSDFWGFGNAIVLMGISSQINITNNWIHDAANASPQAYHTDGPGYLNGAAGPSNVLIQGNTIASLGNTNGLAFQAATSGYNNMQFKSNYLSGFGYLIALGRAGGGIGFTNSSFENNVIGTDIQWVFGPIYNNYTTDFSGSGNTWTGNTIHILSGTASANTSGFTFNSSQNGYYIWPDSSLHSTDF